MQNDVIYCKGSYIVGGQRVPCAFAEGLPKEMASIARVDLTRSRCNISTECCLSIKCKLCKKPQYCCLLCNVFFRRKKHLVQHVQKGRKHLHLVEEMVDPAKCTNYIFDPPANKSIQQPNKHLDYGLMCDNEVTFPDDDDDDSFFNDEPMYNPHLEDDLDSEQDDGSNSSVAELNDAYANFKTKVALERLRLVEDVQRLVHDKNSCSSIDNDCYDLDLMDLRLIVGRALGVKDKSECLRVHPVNAARHLLFTKLMESVTESRREEIMVLLCLNKLADSIFDASNKWLRTELSSNTKVLHQVT